LHEGGIDDAEVVVFPQKRLLVHAADFDVVDAVYIGQIGAGSQIGQRPELTDALLLLVDCKVRQGVVAG
jgi:hypothetical protein